MKTDSQRVLAMQRRIQRPGFPYRQANAARFRVPTAPVRPAAAPTLLDEVGRVTRTITQQQVRAWAEELARHPAASRAALLHVWLGEWQLGDNQQPELADHEFQAAQRLTTPTQPVFGLAAYDRATALYCEGAYGDAVEAFSHLLAFRPWLSGFDHRYAALWLRHAGACAGYHLDRANAGIPEPPRLDPLCGAAALAASLRALRRPYDRKTVLAVTHVTGEGSSLQDVVDGARNLGLNARTVRADDQGLMLLPKPLVAYVEHDHFVSVVRADEKGVSYLCSDCGAWPGGRVDLTWTQWHMLNGGLYAVITHAGSTTDRLLNALTGNAGTHPEARGGVAAVGASSPLDAMSSVLRLQPLTASLGLTRHCQIPIQAPIRLAFIGSLADLHLSLNALQILGPQGLGMTLNVATEADLAVLRRHVILTFSPTTAYCGSKNDSQHCLFGTVCCPKKGGSDAGGGASDAGDNPNSENASESSPRSMTAAGPTSGDPVNLATGEEEYAPKPDLKVYNPHGPDAIWGRMYNSMRRPGQGYIGDTAGDSYYQMNDFGEGWSRSYNVGVYDSSNGAVGSSNVKYVFFENGARASFTAPSVPTSTAPQVLCSLQQAGTPMLVYWDYAASGNYYTILFGDRHEWITTAAIGTNGASCYALSQFVDRNGNAITFNYGPAAGGPFAWPLLSSITNQDGTALLTVVRVGDGTGNIAEIHDCYGRSVLYHVSTYATHSGNNTISYAELDHVSQLAPTGTPAPADRYVYSYINVAAPTTSAYAYPFLHSVTVPNPTGNGASTATINYDQTTEFVSSINDSNGNSTSFASVTAGGTPGGSSAPAAGSTLTVTASQPSNYTQVTVSGNGTSYSYVSGYDTNMSGALMTDGSGRVTETKTFDATSADPYRPTSETNGNGNVTHYVWDQFGRLHQQTSPRGTVTNYTWAFPSGQVPSVVNSVAATGTGFAMGELISTQQGNKTATLYGYYEPSGLVKSITAPCPGTAGNGQQVTSSYTYDSLGNFLTITTPGNNSVGSITTTFNYTTDGAYSQSAATGQALTISDNLGETIHQRYDARGNRVSRVDETGNEIDVSYNIADQDLQTVSPATGQTGSGKASTVTAWLYPDGPKMQVSRYDESNNLVRQDVYTYGVEGEQLSVTGSDQSTYFTYDARYRPSSIKDGNGGTTSFGYNAQGYVSSIKYPDGKTMQFPSYDANGNVLQAVDGRGVTTNYLYNDPESALTDIQYPASSALNVHFAYDAYGRASSMTDGAGVSTYAYDDTDNKTSVVTTYSGLTAQTISYGYNPDGSRQAMNTPGGNFAYLYDGVGRRTQLTNPFGEITTWAYQANSWLSSQDNSVFTASFTRNARGLVTDMSYRTDGQSGTLLSDFGSLLYDAVGNISSVTASFPSAPSFGGTTNYTFDAKNQLMNEQSTSGGGYANGFVYDPAGNPTTSRGASGNTFNSSNQLTNAGYLYDGSGNPTTYKGVSLTFDAQNRMTQYGTYLTAGYRGDDLRAWKQTSVGRTYFLYDGSDLVCELSATGGVYAVNTFSSGLLVSRHTGTTSTFYTFDTHGCVAQRVSSNGSLLSTQSVDSYGKRQSSDSNTDPYCGFAGQSGGYTDYETGLVLLTFRYYDPMIGRFLNRDPAGAVGGINLYEYAGNNPIVKHDPLGLDDGGGGGGGGSIAFESGALACVMQIFGNSANPDPSACEDAVNCLVDLASSFIEGIAEAILELPETPQDIAIQALVGAIAGFISGFASCIGDLLCKLCVKQMSVGQIVCEIGRCCAQALIDAFIGAVEAALCGILPLPWLVKACKLLIEGLLGFSDGAGISLPDCPESAAVPEQLLPLKLFPLGIRPLGIIPLRPVRGGQLIA